MNNKKIFTLIATMCLSTIIFTNCNGSSTPNSNFEKNPATSSSMHKNENTQTPFPSSTPHIEIPEGTDYITLPVDYEEKIGPIITGLDTMAQKSSIVLDPENKKKLSTNMIAHWFGKDTPKQPKIFQQQFEKNKWSALTYDAKSEEKVIYLTFDCGYENGYTSKILDTLKEKNAPAAFFVTMEYLQESPTVAARMIREGHIVGNHSTTHPDFSTINRVEIADELQKLDNYLRVNFGYSSNYFRYPMGRYSENSMELLTSMGYRCIFWSYAYADYDEIIYGNKYAYNKVVNNLHPGEVLLLHAISADNAGALGDIIDYIRDQGYEIRSLNEYEW